MTCRNASVTSRGQSLMASYSCATSKGCGTAWMALCSPTLCSTATTSGTDKGQVGMENFFKTHVCSPLCRRLGLKPFLAGVGG
mmetsp:Transcript_39065/g.96779  ORF Transcript_39065/g.96779 Transcript_39065/m.96779 type:complete len:83 (-) Transcript_39065:415-663(-)